MLLPQPCITINSFPISNDQCSTLIVEHERLNVKSIESIVEISSLNDQCPELNVKSATSIVRSATLNDQHPIPIDHCFQTSFHS